MRQRLSTGRPDAASRFWASANKRERGCWLWTGARTAAGYGRLRSDGRDVYAHRFSYQLLVGPIPEGLELDHLCRTPRCVNPEHLEPVTHAENVRRGRTTRVRTHCGRGHELTPDNVYVYAGRRPCRACAIQRARNRRAELQRRGLA